MVLQYLVAALVLSVSAIYLYFNWLYRYWSRRNVSYITPRILLGNLEYPWAMKRGFVGTLADAYAEFKSQGKRFGGLFILHKPTFMPVDPELIKRMMTVDFQHFMNHGNFVDEEMEPLSANLLNLEDEKWKRLRTKLTPTFTSGKMKVMYDEMKSCGAQMIEFITALNSERAPLDIKEIVSCYSTDIIGSCAFGVDCNSFKNPDAGFRKYGRKVTEMDFWTALRMFTIFFLPEVKRLFRIKSLSPEVETFFTNAFKDVLNHRTTTNSKRNDFIQILLELGSGHGGSTKGLTTEEMLAQAFIFFGAGFETSATNLAFCLYELALQQDIQQKVREEIVEVLNRHNGEMTYEAIMDMKYMDQVLDESLRKHPPIPFLNRQCGKEYKIPGSDLIIEKGTSVMISAYGLQMDPDYFPDPEKFDPDRFSKENKPKIVPFTFLPFGDGPRVCIGQRFAVLQNKIGLCLILKEFRILPHETTPKRIRINPRAVTTVSLDKILLRSEAV
ncbi:Cytochrome P450 [Popillia japonica]|uniref:Cytochrome P450 n=1 Tax=Popillia japonica TaxID=7064 RepID=A0AAW1I8V7_POPJA